MNLIGNAYEKLNEDELSVLMYSLNNHSEDEENWKIKYEDLPKTRKRFVEAQLRETYEKIKESNIPILQSIVDKLNEIIVV